MMEYFLTGKLRKFEKMGEDDLAKMQLIELG